MPEVLTETRKDVWSDPAKLRFFRELIVSHVHLQRQIDRFKNSDGRVSMRAVTRRDDVNTWLSSRDAKRSLNNRTLRVTERVADRYLRSGVRILTSESNWDSVGDYLLTPESERHPIEGGYWQDVVSAIGAVSLVSRFSGQSVMINYNGTAIEGRSDIHPKEVYTSWLEAIQDEREAARVAHLQSVV